MLERLAWLRPGAGLVGWLLLLAAGAAAGLYAVLIALAALFSSDLAHDLGVGGLDGRPWLASAAVAGLLALGVGAVYYGLHGVVRFSRSTDAGAAPASAPFSRVSSTRPATSPPW